jgi:hypothetical protein
MQKQKSAFQLWQSGNLSQLGKFQWSIFRAYQIADDQNARRLEKAFPEWFLH